MEKSDKKHDAEFWVKKAKEFGDKCLEIQNNSKLDFEAQLKEQKHLSEQFKKEIQSDSSLKEEDKKQMISSLESYLSEWQKMHQSLHNATK